MRIIRGLCGAVFGAFFVWGLLLLPLLNVSATLHWLLILVAAALFFVLERVYGDRAFDWLKDLWEWIGL